MSLTDKKGKQRPLVDGLATETTLAALSHAEDSAHATGDKGVPIWGVRVDAYPPDGGVFGADGDYTPIATNYKGDVKVAPQNVAGATINPATEESVKGIAPLSGAGVNGTVALASADTWYSVPSTVPTSPYVLVVTIENALGDIRFGFDNTGTPSATNGNIAPSQLTLKLAASQVVYYASTVAGDDVNWSTKIL